MVTSINTSDYNDKNISPSIFRIYYNFKHQKVKEVREAPRISKLNFANSFAIPKRPGPAPFLFYCLNWYKMGYIGRGGYYILYVADLNIKQLKKVNLIRQSAEWSVLQAKLVERTRGRVIFFFILTKM